MLPSRPTPQQQTFIAWCTDHGYHPARDLIESMPLVTDQQFIDMMLCGNLTVDAMGYILTNPNSAAVNHAFMNAIHAKHTYVFSFLLVAGADINHADEQGNTPLLLAIHANYEHAIQALCARPDLDVNKINYTGASALKMAIYHNQADLAGVLLEKGADLNLPMDPWEGGSLLNFTMLSNKLLCALPLLQYGAAVPELHTLNFALAEKISAGELGPLYTLVIVMDQQGTYEQMLEFLESLELFTNGSMLLMSHIVQIKAALELRAWGRTQVNVDVLATMMESTDFRGEEASRPLTPLFDSMRLRRESGEEENMDDELASKNRRAYGS